MIFPHSNSLGMPLLKFLFNFKLKVIAFLMIHWFFQPDLSKHILTETNFEHLVHNVFPEHYSYSHVMYKKKKIKTVMSNGIHTWKVIRHYQCNSSTTQFCCKVNMEF